MNLDSFRTTESLPGLRAKDWEGGRLRSKQRRATTDKGTALLTLMLQQHFDLGKAARLRPGFDHT
jgi:hypothetical protein